MKPVEEVLEHTHDVLGLEELLALQTVLPGVAWQVVQDEGIHEVDDILHVVGGCELFSTFQLIPLVEAPGEQYHEHEQLVEETRLQLAPVDLHQELAKDMVACVLVQILFFVELWFGLFVVRIYDVKVAVGAQLLQLARPSALDVGNIVAQVVNDVASIVVGLTVLFVHVLGARPAPFRVSLWLRLDDFAWSLELARWVLCHYASA